MWQEDERIKAKLYPKSRSLGTKNCERIHNWLSVYRQLREEISLFVGCMGVGLLLASVVSAITRRSLGVLFCCAHA